MKNLLEVNKHGVLAPIHGVRILIPKITINAGGDIWDKLAGLIEDYAKVYPDDMRATLYENKIIRMGQRNLYGSNKSNSFRWGINLPPGLSALITRFFPGIWDGKRGKENYRKFMRKFPGFRVCEKI